MREPVSEENTENGGRKRSDGQARGEEHGEEQQLDCVDFQMLIEYHPYTGVWGQQEMGSGAQGSWYG